MYKSLFYVSKSSFLKIIIPVSFSCYCTTISFMHSHFHTSIPICHHHFHAHFHTSIPTYHHLFHAHFHISIECPKKIVPFSKIFLWASDLILESFIYQKLGNKSKFFSTLQIFNMGGSTSNCRRKLR